MTAFIAEANRLGIPISTSHYGMPSYGVDVDNENLCVSECPQCRNFRNEVRAALDVEEALALAEQEFLMWLDGPTAAEVAYQQGYADALSDAIDVLQRRELSLA